MKIKETVTIQKEIEVVRRVECDKCRKKIEHERFNSFDFKFAIKTGTHYPEGGSGNLVEMELCEPCAEILVSFLSEAGYRTTTSEWDV